MPTIKEVSQLAHVSPSTVSRVLNGTTPVSADTRERVLRAIEELDYTPNAFARGLATNRSGGIGVTTNDIGSPYYAVMLRGVEAAIEDAGLHLMVSSGHARAGSERSAIQFLKARRSDALIVQAEALSDAELIDQVDQAGVPVVVFGRRIPELDTVCVHLDNEAGGRIATDHLLRHGHRRIAHIAGPLRFPDARHRLQGYREALDAAGIAYDDHLVVEGDFREGGGRAAMERLLDRTTDLDAVFVANDQMAAGAMRAARDRGLDVPRDLSLVGYDDVLLAQYLSPALTTVRQPLFDMGRAAADIAIALLEQRKVEVRTRFEPELVVRESVAHRAT
jgi:LacI family transcriptional regulator